MNVKKLVFTDLDGSLLDHHDYDYSAALPAINKLTQCKIPWIITTSKTAAEVIELRAELENTYPFIVENGAGIFWPTGSLDSQILHNSQVLQKPVVQKWRQDFQYMSLSPVLMPEILKLAQMYKQQMGLSFIGFSEMSAEQVADCTGLTLEKAIKAKQREFSEPLLWQDSEANLIKLTKAMSLHGLQLIKGGRFVHLMGQSNKGLALKVLADYYHQAWQESVETMALGDGNNDIPLLEASDYPVIIRSPVNQAPLVKHNKIIFYFHGSFAKYFSIVHSIC
ncbi:MAG: HAD-IIB family hydrolase [Pseudomonadota bacterium]|nr:HAD-IIB family hydrolase [Pseudomonadota bacterium]